MKPEVVTYLFEYYLSKKKDTSSCYNDVKVVSNTRRKIEICTLAGEAGFENYDRCNELLYLMPESSSPYEPCHVPLDRQEERQLSREEARKARDVAQQISKAFDAFMEVRTAERASGNNTFQFENRCLFVSPCSEKVEIPIVRVGNAQNEFTVAWKAKDKTAQASVHYDGSDGNVSFLEGEAKKFIEINLLGKHEEISFSVELLASGLSKIGSINRITVYITHHEHLCPAEMNVVENIVEESRRFSLARVIDCLLEKVTVNTFRAALMCASSNADSVIQEFTFAFELASVVLSSIRQETVRKVICDFFQPAPELEDLSSEEKEDAEPD